MSECGLGISGCGTGVSGCGPGVSGRGLGVSGCAYLHYCPIQSSWSHL